MAPERGSRRWAARGSGAARGPGPGPRPFLPMYPPGEYQQYPIFGGQQQPIFRGPGMNEPLQAPPGMPVWQQQPIFRGPGSYEPPQAPPGTAGYWQALYSPHAGPMQGCGGAPPYVHREGIVEHIELRVSSQLEKLRAEGQDRSLETVLRTLPWPPPGAHDLRWEDVPSLRRIADMEARVNLIIQCHVAAHHVTTLHDLERDVVAREQVSRYEDLGLGPLWRHHVVVRCFDLPEDLQSIYRLTAADVVQSLALYLGGIDNEVEVDPVEFMGYLAKERCQPSAQCLGVRLRSLRTYVGAIRGAQRAEKELLARFTAQARVKADVNCRSRGIMKRVGRFLDSQNAPTLSQHQVAKSGVSGLQSSVSGEPGPSAAGGTDGSSSCDIRSSGLRNKRKRSLYVPPSRCPYPSAAEENYRLQKKHKQAPRNIDPLRLDYSDLKEFWRTLKAASRKRSFQAVLYTLKTMWGNTKKTTFFGKQPYLGLLNVAVLAVKSGLLEDYISIPAASTRRNAEVDSRTMDLEAGNETASGESKATGPNLEELLTLVVKDFENFSVANLARLSQTFDCVNDNGTCHVWWANLIWVAECSQRLEDELFRHYPGSSPPEAICSFILQKWNSLPDQLRKFMTPRSGGVLQVAVKVPEHRLVAFCRQASSAAEKSEDSDMQHTMKIQICDQFQTGLEELKHLQVKQLIDCSETSETSVLYSAALFPRIQGLVDRNDQAAIRNPTVWGRKTDLDALGCLQRVPPLCDLSFWSHWDFIFAPWLGSLQEWIEKAGKGKLTILVTTGGKLLRVDVAKPNDFVIAVSNKSAHDIAACIASLFVNYGGAGHVPRSLLQSCTTKGLKLRLQSGLTFSAEGELSASEGQEKDLAFLILECLQHLPSELRILAAQIFLDSMKELDMEPFSLIWQSCRTDEQRIMLQRIGFELGTVEWIDDHHPFDNLVNLEVCDQQGVPVVEKDAFQQIATDVHFQPVSPSDHGLVAGGNLGPVEVLKHTHSSMPPPPPEIQCAEPRAVIEAIRREEFGLGPELGTSENKLLAKQHARMGRALDRLSRDLYSEDAHFGFELIQNADDNSYELGVEATLVFVIRVDDILILNNETGFTEANMRALCDIGNSTKAGRAGYIGQKGIGFRSTFRVSNAPEVHSKGYHVKFDVSEGQVGFLAPTLIPELPVYGSLSADLGMQLGRLWTTYIRLPLKPEIQASGPMSKLAKKFDNFHPSLLLFLQKLRCIGVQNEVTGSTHVLRRKDLGGSLVSVVSDKAGVKADMTWLVVRSKLESAICRAGVRKTEIVLAFPVMQDNVGGYLPHYDKQKVFSFLPLRRYGLRFILQADFILTSSREEVDRDNDWNEWVLSEVPTLFLEALDKFKHFSPPRSLGQVVEAYMGFVPLDGEVLGFFAPLPRLILSRLRASECLPIDGKAGWALPCFMLRSWSAQFRSVVPDTMLEEHLGLHFLDRDVNLPDTLAESLGIQSYGSHTLVSLITAVSRKRSFLESRGPRWVRDWLILLHGSIHRPEAPTAVSSTLRQLHDLPFIPLSNGSFSSLSNGPLWFLGGNAMDAVFSSFPLLSAELQTVHSGLMWPTDEKGQDDTGVLVGCEADTDKVRQLLSMLGVHQVSCHEVIKTHVLPAFSDDQCFTKNPALVVEYLAFTMLHLQSDCSQCKHGNSVIDSGLKDYAVILTNGGLKRVGSEPIHFPRIMGNPINVKPILEGTGIVWNEIDAAYLKLNAGCLPERFSVQRWRSFFTELGVSDFLETKAVPRSSRSVIEQGMEVSGTLHDSVIEQGMEVSGPSHDWTCPELLGLLQALCGRAMKGKQKFRQKQLEMLLKELDRWWDEGFKQSPEPTFISQLRQLKCLKSSLSGQLELPTDLFDKCSVVELILGANAPYSLPQLSNKGLKEALGLRNKVSVGDALWVLQKWQNCKHRIVASYSQMEQLYNLLWQATGTEREAMSQFMMSSPSILLPKKFVNVPEQSSACWMDFYMARDTYWEDPTGAVKAALETKSESCAEILVPIQIIYPKLHEFFVEVCRVQQRPSFDVLFKALVCLSTSYSPYETLGPVVEIFRSLSRDLQCANVQPSEVARWKSCFEEESTCVLPTMQNKWVSLNPSEGVICVSDDVTLRERLSSIMDQMHFLFLFHDDGKPDREMGISNMSDFLPLIRELKIPLLSEIMNVKVIARGHEDGSAVLRSLWWSIPYIQRYLLKNFPEKYEKLQSADIGRKVSGLECHIVNQLQSQHVLKQLNWSSVPKDCSCILQESTLLVTQPYQLFIIFLELSKVFLSGHSKLQLELANFLQLLSNMRQSGASMSEVEDFVVRVQGIPPLAFNGTSCGTWVEADFSLRYQNRVADDPTADASLAEGKLDRLGTGDHQDACKAERESATMAYAAADMGKQSIAAQNASEEVFLHSDERAFALDSRLRRGHSPRGQLHLTTGRLGEETAFMYLAEQHGAACVTWVNEGAESGTPFDLIVNHESGGQTFVEVKTTRSDDKDWFEISQREWECAQMKGDNYMILRVQLGHPPRFLELRNPVKLCQDKRLQLAMLLPDSVHFQLANAAPGQRQL